MLNDFLDAPHARYFTKGDINRLLKRDVMCEISSSFCQSLVVNPRIRFFIRLVVFFFSAANKNGEKIQLFLLWTLWQIQVTLFNVFIIENDWFFLFPSKEDKNK